jgi:hypothetical protein
MQPITYRFLLEANERYNNAQFSEALNICRNGLKVYPRTLSAYSIAVNSILHTDGSTAAEKYVSEIPESILAKPTFDIFISNLKTDIQKYKDENGEGESEINIITDTITEEIVNPYEVEDEGFKFGNFLEKETDTEEIEESASEESESQQNQEEPYEEFSEDSSPYIDETEVDTESLETIEDQQVATPQNTDSISDENIIQANLSDEIVNQNSASDQNEINDFNEYTPNSDNITEGTAEKQDEINNFDEDYSSIVEDLLDNEDSEKSFEEVTSSFNLAEIDVTNEFDLDAEPKDFSIPEPSAKTDFENEIAPQTSSHETLVSEPEAIEKDELIDIADDLPEEKNFSESELIVDENSIIEEFENEEHESFDNTLSSEPEFNDSSTYPPKPEEEEMDMLEAISEEVDDISPENEFIESQQTEPFTDSNIKDAAREASQALFDLENVEEQIETNGTQEATELIVSSVDRVEGLYQRFTLPDENKIPSQEEKSNIQTVIIDGNDLLPPILEPMDIFDEIPFPKVETSTEPAETSEQKTPQELPDDTIDVASLDLYSDSVRESIISKGMKQHKLRLIPGFEKYTDFNWDI